MAMPAKKTKAKDLAECPYGARCYRKNPQHLAEFSHPKKAKVDSTDSASDADDTTDGAKQSVDGSSLPPCRYGAKCYRKNLLHFAEYSHPTGNLSPVQGDSDSGNDTDVLEDDEVPGTSKGSTVGATDILKRGMSLVKSYSAMSESERKELIKKAFEVKQQLQKELDKTKEEVKKKEMELEKLQKQIATGTLLIEGEKEALEGKNTVYFDLYAERAYKEGSADQIHFRLAESQFYRLLVGSNAGSHRITKIQYVVNPESTKKFKKCMENLKKTRGEEFSYPVLGFHGTEEKNITPICEDGFRIPGKQGHKHRTDTGWYGKGVYFSEYPAYSMSYIQGSSKLMLCQVLLGKVYNCSKLLHGAALMKGYDSHTSPDKKELVIFNRDHILPAYIVHYQENKGEFKYKAVKKGEKEEAIVIDDSDLPGKFAKASEKKKSKVLDDYTVQFTGSFTGSQKQMMELALKHGASKGTKTVFNLLISATDDSTSSKAMEAHHKMVPVVPEVYLYDCILQGKKLCTSDYEYS